MASRMRKYVRYELEEKGHELLKHPVHFNDLTCHLLVTRFFFDNGTSFQTCQIKQ